MSDLIETTPPVISGDAGPRANRDTPLAVQPRTEKSPAIYHIQSGLWTVQDFAEAKNLGFNTILLAPPFATSADPSDPRAEPAVFDYDTCSEKCDGGDPLVELTTAASAAREAGLDLFIDLAPDRLAPGAPLLTAHPDWFVHAAGGAAFSFLGETDATVDWWDERIALWQQTGITGFRCLAADSIPAFVWTRLIAAAKTRDPSCLFLTWTPGLAPAAIAALHGCGFDFCFSSSCWWNFLDSWLTDDAERLAALAPAIALAAPPGTETWAEPARRRALSLAAFYAPAWLMEAGFHKTEIFDLSDTVQSLNAQRRDHPTLTSPASASIISSTAAPITLLYRQTRPHPHSRESGNLLASTPLILALNPSLTTPAEEPLSAILPATGLTHLETQTETLTPASVLSLVPGGAEIFTATTGADVFLPVAIPLDTGAARIGIESITPQVDAGEFPVRRIIGDMVTVQADLLADGHDKLAAELLYRAVDEKEFRGVPMTLLNNDRWQAAFPLERLGRHEFTVQAWRDAYATFVDEVTKKHAAKISVTLELQEGLAIVAETLKLKSRPKLAALYKKLQTADDETRRVALLDPATIALMRKADLRKFATTSHPIIVDAERRAAGFSAWYEIFPRSQHGDGATHGTFLDVIAQLPRIADMGFDVLYFPPIHPIGKTNRKGKNNTLTPAPDDPGSPYAIGSKDGGHDAIHPELGTLADFHKLRDAAAALGIELALDFAIQCAPDHPWLKEHPEWFDWRPDGSLRYAENPPKKYEDIVNVDFYAQGAQPSLWLALRDVVQFWVNQGVRLFRVDNPHTKPLPFWQWLITDIRSRHPDALFLAEAFTRPKIMYRLAKIGFSQSYTYFTWRHEKTEIEDYLKELTTTAPRDFFRPHFFVNTPDINPVFLQTSGRGGHLIRAALAATLSGLWGVYNGFELCEATPTAPGKEEYLDSEKYQLKTWDYDRPGNIVAEITKLNRIRKANAALHSHLGLEFLPAYNDQVLYFRKFAPDGNTLLVAISLDPTNIQDATIEVPLWRFGIPDDGAIDAEDLMRDFKFTWRGKYQTVRLNPYDQPFCIWRVSAPIQDQ
jgi:starch synthase (maltosyl-transferring)